MCRRRTRSSGGKLHLGGANHLFSEMPAQLVSGAYINTPPAQQSRQLGFESRETQQAGHGTRLEFHEEIDIASRTGGASKYRAKKGQPANTVAAAQLP
jgi:hypothetical protein